jgi:hypothetical protein
LLEVVVELTLQKTTQTAELQDETKQGGNHGFNLLELQRKTNFGGERQGVDNKVRPVSE